MTRPRFLRGLLSCVLVPIALATGCSRSVFEGVDVAEYVPEEQPADVITSLDLAGDNGDEILPADARVVTPGAGEESYVTRAGATVAVPADPDGTPVVALFEAGSAVEIAAIAGYDLNVDRVLSDAIDGHLKELSER